MTRLALPSAQRKPMTPRAFSGRVSFRLWTHATGDGFPQLPPRQARNLSGGLIGAAGGQRGVSLGLYQSEHHSATLPADLVCRFSVQRQEG